MRKRIKAGIGLLLSVSVAFSALAFPGDRVLSERALAATEDSDSGNADVVTDSENYTYTLYTQSVTQGEQTVKVQKAEITGYTGTNWDLVIPASVSGQSGDIPVGRIQDQAFKGNTQVTGVCIPDQVTEIGEMAFYGCSSLVSLRLPAALEEFGYQAFAGCSSLRNLEIPEGVKEMGAHAFEGCTSLVQVNIPSTIERWQLIDGINIMVYDCSAFKDCTSLEQVTFAEGLKTLFCATLFPGCTALKTVTVPASVTNLEYAFHRSESLEEVILQEGDLQEIGKHAFDGCTSLKGIEIPSTVTAIGEYAFNECNAMESIILPPSVNYFSGNQGPIKNCANLKSVYVLSETISGYLSLGGDAIYCLENSQTWDALQSSSLRRALNLALAGVNADLDRTLVYDKTAQPLVELTGAEEGDEISYQMVEQDGTLGEAVQDIPTATDPGTYTVQVTLKRGKLIYRDRVEVEIQKRQSVIRLGDMTVYENDDWSVTPQEYDGPSAIEYTYYRDETLRKKCTGKPTAAGVYYVKATVAEDAHYLASESNVAKIEILAGSAPVVTPPSGDVPSPSPGQSPSPTPPTTTNSSNSTGGSANSTKALTKGAVFTAGALKYKVTSATGKNLAVAVQTPKNRNAKSITIPAAVKTGGTSYKVTSVGANAFKNCKKLEKLTVGKNVTAIGKNAFCNAKKLKRITVKSTVLKSVGKNALKGISKKALIKVPKKKLKKYTKLLKGKGQKKTVKVK